LDPYPVRALDHRTSCPLLRVGIDVTPPTFQVYKIKKEREEEEKVETLVLEVMVMYRISIKMQISLI